MQVGATPPLDPPGGPFRRPRQGPFAGDGSPMRLFLGTLNMSRLVSSWRWRGHPLERPVQGPGARSGVLSDPSGGSRGEERFLGFKAPPYPRKLSSS